MQLLWVSIRHVLPPVAPDPGGMLSAATVLLHRCTAGSLARRQTPAGIAWCRPGTRSSSTTRSMSNAIYGPGVVIPYLFYTFKHPLHSYAISTLVLQ